jgi:cytochrome c-type biogenesis protein CcmF
MAHKVEREFSLKLGESYTLGRFKLELTRMGENNTPAYSALVSSVDLKLAETGEVLKTLYPEMRMYFRNQETTTEVALRTSAREDVYLVLAGFDGATQRASFKAFINPLQIWLWIGVITMIVGTVLCIVPQRVRVMEQVVAPVEVRQKA